MIFLLPIFVFLPLCGFLWGINHNFSFARASFFIVFHFSITAVVSWLSHNVLDIYFSYVYSLRENFNRRKFFFFWSTSSYFYLGLSLNATNFLKIRNKQPSTFLEILCTVRGLSTAMVHCWVCGWTVTMALWYLECLNLRLISYGQWFIFPKQIR